MIRSLAALAIFALLGAGVIALPGFAPKVEAGEAAVLTKSDRLAVFIPPPDCSKQVWPDFAASCLKNQSSPWSIVQARLVTARRKSLAPPADTSRTRHS
jgi:hypothetical protein